MKNEPSQKQLKNLIANEGFIEAYGDYLPLSVLQSYDKIIIAFSGGKDSEACFLHLLDMGVAKENIELWHHDVDGREGSTLMDWACTASYCRAFAEAFGVEIYFSWRVGGIEGEMLRENSQSHPIRWEEPTGSNGDTTIVESESSRSSFNTRLRWPAKTASLATRWCSSNVKIEVGNRSLNAQTRFLNKRTLFVTGERAQESTNRSYYARFEKHACHAEKRVNRHVDAYRPVLDWSEQDVWAIIEKHNVNPHPAYKLGWGRVSCAACIFGNADQWASLQKVNEGQFNQVHTYENLLEHTIDNKLSIVELAEKGTAYDMKIDDVVAAIAHEYINTIIVKKEDWELPKGAYGDSCGPS